jgi:hypothetical protein
MAERPLACTPRRRRVLVPYHLLRRAGARSEVLNGTMIFPAPREKLLKPSQKCERPGLVPGEGRPKTFGVSLGCTGVRDLNRE